MEDAKENMRHIFFIGIGGIGMSALARFYNAKKIKVSGYDKTETVLTRKLEAENIEIFYEDQIDFYPKDVDLVIYTPAIPEGHKGLNFYQYGDYEVIKRAEALGDISRAHRTIAIAGTHGKTSTSTMAAHLLKDGKNDASAFLGGIPVDYGSNFLSGKSDWIIAEADEFDRSFLHLTPDIAAIMSTDADHLDIYGAHDEMIDGFRSFAKKLTEKGILLLNKQVEEKLLDDASLVQKLKEKKIMTISFSAFQDADVMATNVRVMDGIFRFDVKMRNAYLAGFDLKMAGRHNVENALVAIFIAYILGEPMDEIAEKLRNFNGIKRRFEVIYKDEKIIYIDDYAHHPTELNAAIGAAKELFPMKKITGIFQPHLFSRTRDFAEGFAMALDRLDEIVLLNIYPARELPMEGITSQLIFDKMKNKNKEIGELEDCVNRLKDKDIEVLLTLGAGNIDTRVPMIKEWLEARK